MCEHDCKLASNPARTELFGVKTIRPVVGYSKRPVYKWLDMWDPRVT